GRTTGELTARRGRGEQLGREPLVSGRVTRRVVLSMEDRVARGAHDVPDSGHAFAVGLTRLAVAAVEVEGVAVVGDLSCAHTEHRLPGAALRARCPRRLEGRPRLGA